MNHSSMWLISICSIWCLLTFCCDILGSWYIVLDCILVIEIFYCWRQAPCLSSNLVWLLLQWPFSFLGTELTGSLPGQPMAGNISFLGHPLLLGNVGWWGNHIMENISSSCMSVTGYQYASQSVSASAPEKGRFFI